MDILAGTNQNLPGKKLIMSSKSPRFFDQQNFTVLNNFTLSEPNSHKIISVLKLPIGSIINIFNNSNTNIEFIAKITNIKNFKNKKNNKLIEIQILQAISNNLESPLKIHLAQAIAKHDNMDLIIQKSVELGVYQITPIITDRTIVKIAAHQLIKKIEHWQAIAINACCQCGRNIIPKINSILSFNDFINNANTPNKFILSPINNSNNSHNLNNLDLNLTKEITLVIGPEGGFTNTELTLAEQNQFHSLTIGPRILRTETAPIVALSVFQAKYGDFNL